MHRNAFRTDAATAGDVEPEPGFQPILDVETGRTVAWEAIESQCIEPAIATAARAGLLEGDAVLALSPPMALAPDRVAAHLFCAAVSHGISTRRLLVRIRADERCDAGGSAVLARACRDHGMKIALHAYSAGPRGMRLLVETRPHFLALDPALTRNLAASPSRRRIVESVLRLADDLGATVVATDISSGADLVTLHRLGVTLFQSEAFCLHHRGIPARPHSAAPAMHAPRQPLALHAA
jgi:blue light- and temperature-responsive anti-repressor